MAKVVKVGEFRAVLDAEPKTQLLDVRESNEFSQDGGVFGSILAPLSTDVAAAGLFDAQKPVYILCRSDARSRKAAFLLEGRGFVDVRVIEGGVESWKAAGYPLVRAGTGWAIERQVRFTVGVLLLTSFALGRLAHPVFDAVAPLMGAGLLYAALSDSCAMGAVIMKLPWNRS